MPQTRMFRDRVVSMEQTLEGGEKHLELLKTLCREALPDFEYVAHSLDHERDLFVMELSAGDGRLRRIGWTRMVLYDAERIPVLSGDPAGGLRERIIQFIRARASRSEVVVTFRHLEDGWVDTPEPRRDRGRRRRRGRGEAKGGAPERPGGRRPAPGQAPPPSPKVPRPPGRPAARPAAPRPVAAAGPPAAGAPVVGIPAESVRSDGRRRRSRRRRRGRGPGGGGAPVPPASAR
ncbi:MAG: hypothetical protein ABJC28_04390 [Acidobacteriota bacterium]